MEQDRTDSSEIRREEGRALLLRAKQTGRGTRPRRHWPSGPATASPALSPCLRPERLPVQLAEAPGSVPLEWGRLLALPQRTGSCCASATPPLLACHNMGPLAPGGAGAPAWTPAMLRPRSPAVLPQRVGVGRPTPTEQC